jgi:hypothetical protein
MTQGFRMTVGSPTTSSKPHVGLRYQCVQGQNRGAEMPDFPMKPCSSGIFVTQHFPALVSVLLTPFFRIVTEYSSDAGTA